MSPHLLNQRPSALPSRLVVDLRQQVFNWPGRLGGRTARRHSAGDDRVDDVKHGLQLVVFPLAT
ncbi:hypothetical protein [Micromonospora sp. ATA51]|uniref:hypothetical protein n=1 Tax=Micromonospora sp. ATA51 TaxID=2806098 RepID=UPI001A3C196E|nr:hypothetical protein [Micromonospora sp. ATA51]MBM0224391.1 hypothetical protein [Micromonospora sp. ATA51]